MAENISRVRVFIKLIIWLLCIILNGTSYSYIKRKYPRTHAQLDILYLDSWGPLCPCIL